MKFVELAESVKGNHDNYGHTPGEIIHYARVLNPGYDLDNLTLNDCEKIYDFLNTWGRCRLKRNPSALFERLQKVTAWLNPMRHLRIENINVNLDLIIGVVQENMTLGHATHYVFDELADIPSFGPVPASKTLHAIAPSFFVMWDNSIARDYDCRLRGFDYAFKFLPRIKQEIDECIQDVMTRQKVERDRAVDYIVGYGQSIWQTRRTIAKLVDEFNWMNRK